MLLLAGLPTLCPSLVESRTYSERMFRVMTLHNLSPGDSRKAIAKPLAEEPLPTKIFFDDFNDAIYDLTKGYPYFIQFWCRELYDYLAERPIADERDAHIVKRITHKLDMDFFGRRWARLTDRQRDLLTVIAHLS